MNEMWEQRVREQNEDFETDKIRQDIQINLTDKKYSNLKLMAYKAGFKSAGEFLSSFVGDLTGWQSNGSDERDLADQWYDRAFGMSEYYENFRYYLYNYDCDLDTMKQMLDDADYFEEVYAEYKDEAGTKEIESKESCLAVLKELIDKGEEL